jgi:hypothetical protein
MVSASTAGQCRQNIHWTAGPQLASVEHVRGDHRRFDVPCAEKLVHGTEVGARLQQVRGEGVATGVTSGRLGDRRRLPL